MNEREKLDMMILRANIRSQKKMERYVERWVGKEAVVAGEPKPYQEERKEPAIIEVQDGYS